MTVDLRVSESIVVASDDGGVATVTVGAGERFNAMGRAEWRDLERVVSSCSDDPSLRAVVVRGHGGKFSSGSDLREWASASAGEVTASFAEIESALQAIENLPVPTIAIVQGVAAGAGCQLALSCDLQLMDASALIGMPTAQLGVLVPASFANRLSLRIGPSRAKDLLYGGRLLGAERAELIGLITTVVDPGRMDEVLGSLLGRWGGQSAASLRAAKAAVNLGLAPVTEPARRRAADRATDPEEFTLRVNSFLHRKKSQA